MSSDTPQNFELFSPDVPDVPLFTTLVKGVKEKKWYFLRLTPFDQYVVGNVKELCRELAGEAWILCNETSSKGVFHFHAVILCDKDPRDHVKNFLKEFFPEKARKEDGNKRYNLKLVKDLTKCFTYTTKDGDYNFGNCINPDFVDECYKRSFQKLGVEQWKDEVKLLKQAYLDGDMDPRDLRTAYILLHSKFNKPINLGRVSDWINMVRVSKDPDFAEKL